jgi:hypothetical protein
MSGNFCPLHPAILAEVYIDTLDISPMCRWACYKTGPTVSRMGRYVGASVVVPPSKSSEVPISLALGQNLSD